MFEPIPVDSASSSNFSRKLCPIHKPPVRRPRRIEDGDFAVIEWIHPGQRSSHLELIQILQKAEGERDVKKGVNKMVICLYIIFIKT